VEQLQLTASNETQRSHYPFFFSKSLDFLFTDSHEQLLHYNVKCTKTKIETHCHHHKSGRLSYIISRDNLLWLNVHVKYIVYFIYIYKIHPYCGS